MYFKVSVFLLISAILLTHNISHQKSDEVNVLLPLLIGFIVALVVLAIIILVYYLLRKSLKRGTSICIREPVDETTIHQPPTAHSDDDKLKSDEETEPQFKRSGRDIEICFPTRTSGRGSRGLWAEIDPRAAVTLIEPELLEEIRAERRAALNDSDDENTTDPSVEEHTEEVHDTQSLCDTEATPAAARGAMGSKFLSLPNFVMEREDTDQNTVTQNALLFPLLRRCRSKIISLPNLTLGHQ